MTHLLAIVATLSLATACHKAEKAPASSSPTAPAAAAAATPTAAPAATPTAAPGAAPAAADRFAIKVTEKGFEPDNVKVPAGKPVTLVFERTTDETCAKQVVVTLDDGKTVQKDLPLNQPVEIAATFPKAGTLGWACGMDMLKGTIVVQ